MASLQNCRQGDYVEIRDSAGRTMGTGTVQRPGEFKTKVWISQLDRRPGDPVVAGEYSKLTGEKKRPLGQSMIAVPITPEQYARLAQTFEELYARADKARRAGIDPNAMI